MFDSICYNIRAIDLQMSEMIFNLKMCKFKSYFQFFLMKIATDNAEATKTGLPHTQPNTHNSTGNMT